MTQAEHIELHRELDTLVARYLSRHCEPGEPRTSIHDEIYDLMKWSYEMTLKPMPEPY
jgi:hypothetical protein